MVLLSVSPDTASSDCCVLYLLGLKQRLARCALDCSGTCALSALSWTWLKLQKLRKQVMQGERVPVIHTVGFFAEEQRGGPGERFLRQLSALTGGTFQVSPLSYCPALTCPAIPCPALPSLVLPCPAFSCPALPWPALSCPDLPCPAIPCPALPSLVLPCPAFPCPALPCLGQPCPALSSPLITMLCSSVLLCCAGLGYARLQVPLHAVPVSHNASPPLACNLPATHPMPIICCHPVFLAARHAGRS
jgi:hypothetical protein